VFIANHCKAIFLVLIFTFYANGSACIWLFYECEKDDIIMMISPNGANSQEFALQFVRTALSQHHQQQSKQTIRIIETDIKLSVSSISYFQIYNQSPRLPFARYYDNLSISGGHPFLQIMPPRYCV
jgi:hypothetical protein